MKRNAFGGHIGFPTIGATPNTLTEEEPIHGDEQLAE
jgi:hypothetical protein